MNEADILAVALKHKLPMVPQTASEYPWAYAERVINFGRELVGEPWTLVSTLPTEPGWYLAMLKPDNDWGLMSDTPLQVEFDAYKNKPKAFTVFYEYRSDEDITDAVLAWMPMPKYSPHSESKTVAVQCAARKQSTAGGNAAADCDWPGCGCDETANKVMESLLDGHNLALTFAQRDVLRERAEHATREGFTPAHDDAHKPGALVNAAAAYALAAGDELATRGIGEFFRRPSRVWPFSPTWWKPKNPRTAMVKAAALLLAEIEKIDRAESAV